MQYYETDRLNAVTDGIAAVALTLLVVDIELPPGTTGANLPAVLLEMWTRIELWFASFLVVGLLWFVHHQVLGRQRQVDALAVGCWLVFLAGLALLPFSVTVAADFPGVPVALQLLWGIVWVTAAAMAAQYARICSLPVADEHYRSPEGRRRAWLVLSGPLVASTVCFVLTFVDARAALWGWTPVLALGLVLGRRSPVA